MAYTGEEEFEVQKESILIMELKLQTKDLERYTGKDGSTEVDTVPVLRVKYNVLGGNDIKEIYLEQWYRKTNKKYEFFDGGWNISGSDILEVIAEAESWDALYENYLRQQEKENKIAQEKVDDYFNEK